MTAQKGRLFILKLGDGLTVETFATVAGMRASSLTINNEMVDVTTKDDVGWRKLLDGVSFKSFSISGSGLIQSSANRQAVTGKALSGSIDNYEIYFEDGDKFAGAFQCTSAEITGNHDGAEEYTLSLESSGAVTYTAV
ncbi:phage major tail protein, TP901-1 family [Paremcibacter congregatus]|uniref:phage major tail protein, TP901-1 family n=1 Tax=Paremcibacter congregatus TaxID=2043170 RepID=UPI0030EED79D|tara:strand:- start:3809 stop:4222 length:414 start_codon:yes stop_codon:yes gene_type:complete